MSKRSAEAKPRAVPLPEALRDALSIPGPSFDAGPFALDLYRLLCIVLADKKIGALADDPDYDNMSPIQELQDRFRDGELIRILISSAVALRTLFDRHSQLGPASKKQCGQLWSRWPNGKQKPEPLTLREGCNKIIHARDKKDDLMVPNLPVNPDMIGTYIRPFVDLYGTKNGQQWRAKLSIVEFARHGTFALLRHAKA